MRRGLMGWNAQDELPIGGARRAHRAGCVPPCSVDGLDAVLLYTNLVRPSAVSYLTGFTPYWSDGILLVGRAARRASPPRCRSASPTGSARQPGGRDRQHAAARQLLGARIAADPAVKRVGVLELDALPSGLYDDLVAAAPAVELIDATQLFAAARRGVDAAERRLLARADAIAAAHWIRWMPSARRPVREAAPQRPRTPARSPDWSKSTRVSNAAGGGLYRGRARSRRRSAHDPRRVRRRRSASGSRLRASDRLQGPLGAPRAHLCQGRCRGREHCRPRRCVVRWRVIRSINGARPLAGKSRRRLEELSPAPRSKAGRLESSSAAIRCRSSRRRNRGRCTVRRKRDFLVLTPRAVTIDGAPGSALRPPSSAARL